jgi:hypothetical protein
MMHEFQMYSAVFNGCAAGLTDDNGVPVKKPWRVVTTSPQLAKALSAFTCSCAEKHSPLEGGQKASKSAFFPRKLAEIILSNLFPAVARKNVPAMPTIPLSEPKHRQRLPDFESFCAQSQVTSSSIDLLVHKLLERREMLKDPEALKAISSEAAGLLFVDTWLPDTVCFKKDVSNARKL